MNRRQNKLDVKLHFLFLQKIHLLTDNLVTKQQHLIQSNKKEIKVIYYRVLTGNKMVRNCNEIINKIIFLIEHHDFVIAQSFYTPTLCF